jgi:NDP-sugar pyrophosphorylase family protein
MLIRCACLKNLPRVGFIDLLEQGLPAIARSHRVHVLRTAAAPARSIRTASDYLSVVRQQATRASVIDDPACSPGFASFTLMEEGAIVEPGAVLHDSVVLAGSRVERGARLVRSVACPGAVVRSGSTVVDELCAGSSWATPLRRIFCRRMPSRECVRGVPRVQQGADPLSPVRELCSGVAEVVHDQNIY